MEFIDKEKNKPDNKSTGKMWLGVWGFIITGMVYTLGNRNFVATTIDRFIVLIVSIIAGISFYRIAMKKRFRLKSGIGEDIADALVVLLASGFLIGFLTKVF
jgi:hypothetical protein